MAVPRRHLKSDDRFDSVEGLEVTPLDTGGLRSPRLISSAHGPISHVMLWYPGFGEDADTFVATFVDLLGKLPTHTKVTLAVHPDASAEVERVLADVGERSVDVLTTPEHLNFSIWAEDACVVVSDSSAETVTYLVEPFEFARYGDQVVVDLVANAAQAIEHVQTPLAFQGGNVLIGDDFVLVGRDYLDETIELGMRPQSPLESFPRGAGDQAHEEFARALYPEALDPGRVFHFLESNPAARGPERSIMEIDGERWVEDVSAGSGRRQPIFHIDMFVSLAGRHGDGRYRVLVGDPGLADQILGWDPLPHSLQSEFDDVAAQLTGLGFVVTRTPLPLVLASYKYSAPTAIQVGEGQTVDVVGERAWYHATSNNCLVQIHDGGSEVWLPTYGGGRYPALAPVDAEHKRIWENLGFTVHQLGDFHHLARSAGALHCIKKYLAR